MQLLLIDFVAIFFLGRYLSAFGISFLTLFITSSSFVIKIDCAPEECSDWPSNDQRIWLIEVFLSAITQISLSPAYAASVPIVFPDSCLFASWPHLLEGPTILWTFLI